MNIYQSFYENSIDAVFLTAPDGSIRAANPAACKLFRLTESELCRVGRAGLIDPSSSQIEHLINERERTGSARGELLLVRGDGTRFWGEFTSAQYLGEHNEDRIVVIVRDITERKQMEQKLVESQVLLNAIVNSTADVVWSVNTESFALLSFNQRLYDYFLHQRGLRLEKGMSPKELSLGDSFLEDVWRNFYQRVLKDGPFSTEYALAGGNDIVQLHFNALVHDGEVFGISVFGRNITKRKLAEKSLRSLNRELRALGRCHRSLLRAREEKKLFGEICRIICDEAGYRMAWVGFVRFDDEKKIEPVAWAGSEDGYLAEAEISWAEDKKSGQGPCGRAVRSGESIYVQDIAADPCMAPWGGSALQRGYRSSIALPLKSENGAVFGVLTIYSSDQYAFTPEEIRLLEELAEDMAFGVNVLHTRAERNKVEASLLVKTEQLDRSNMDLRRLTAHREEIREQERMYIARNVHDELGQLLTSLQLNVSTMALKFGKENQLLMQSLDDAQGLVDKSLKVARNIVAALRPASLDMGMAASMEWLAQRYSGNTGIVCDVELINWQDELVDEAGVVALYRIAQESLTNVARHANTDRVTIILKGGQDVCQLVIRDEGVGFDPEQVKKDSFGLMGIRERVTMMRGKFTIDSAVGTGTELMVTIPAVTKAEAA